MLSPHAIWLIPSNMDTILGELPITEAMLLDLHQDSINEKTDYWLATHRIPTGQISWTAYSAEEFETEFGYPPHEKFDTGFHKI